jgi:hypothetical protein
MVALATAATSVTPFSVTVLTGLHARHNDPWYFIFRTRFARAPPSNSRISCAVVKGHHQHNNV